MTEFDYPIIKLPGSETWRSGYEFGDKLAKHFPEQDPYDFAYACEYHGYGPLEDADGFSIWMLEQGDHDGPPWVWYVKTKKTVHVEKYGRKWSYEEEERWILDGWCDFTGWDCQSSATWTKI